MNSDTYKPNWISADLSEEQLYPLNSKDVRKVILAAAGSGKTKTLVHQVADDLISGIHPSEIIAFTFTEKAADELLSRVHFLIKKMHQPLILTGCLLGRYTLGVLNIF